MCSCGHPDIQQIKIADLKRGGRCPNCRNERLKATNMIRYGYEFVSQRPDKKESALSGIRKHIAEKKHTLEELIEFYQAAGCKLLEKEYIVNSSESEDITKEINNVITDIINNNV